MIFFNIKTLDTVLTDEAGIALLGKDDTRKSTILLSSLTDMVSDDNVSNIVPVVNSNVPDQYNLITIAVIVNNMTAQKAVEAAFQDMDVLTVSSESINVQDDLWDIHVPAKWKSQVTVIVNSCKVVFIEPLDDVSTTDITEYLEEIKFNNENLSAVLIDKLNCSVSDRNALIEYTSDQQMGLLTTIDINPSTESSARNLSGGCCRMFQVENHDEERVLTIRSKIFDTGMSKTTTIVFDQSGKVTSVK